jgi:RNA polymerase sigma-70 factor (sigma-E family)
VLARNAPEAPDPRQHRRWNDLADSCLGQVVQPLEREIGSHLPEPVESFEALFRAERDGMVRVAYLLCGTRAEAEELVHDAFVAVYRRWDSLDNPGGYLRRCVVTGSTRHRRRRARGEELALRAAPEPGAAGVDHTLDAVRRLAPRARALVVLRFYAGLTQEEIAAELGIPVGTVKSGLHRALGELREALR